MQSAFAAGGLRDTVRRLEGCMKNTIRFASGTVVALTAFTLAGIGCGPAPTAATVAQPQSYAYATADVSGPWVSYWGGTQVCNLQLQQNGNSVTGSYTTTGAPSGSIAGTLDANNVLTGTWSDQGGGGGMMRLAFSPDGRAFEGTWGSGESSTNGGSWTGNR